MEATALLPVSEFFPARRHNDETIVGIHRPHRDVDRGSRTLERANVNLVPREDKSINKSDVSPSQRRLIWNNDHRHSHHRGNACFSKKMCRSYERARAKIYFSMARGLNRITETRESSSTFTRHLCKRREQSQLFRCRPMANCLTCAASGI